MSMRARYEIIFIFFFNDTATTEIYTLSLHDALPICPALPVLVCGPGKRSTPPKARRNSMFRRAFRPLEGDNRSEEHTSELQSRQYLVCRLLLEKKKK